MSSHRIAFAGFLLLLWIVTPAASQEGSWLTAAPPPEATEPALPVDLVPLADLAEVEAFLTRVQEGSWSPLYVTRVGSLPPTPPEAPERWRPAVDRLADAAQSDDGASAQVLAFLLATGTVVEQDVPAALAWLKVSREAGYPQASYDLAALHLARAVPEGGDRAAALHLRAAAMRGHPVAQDQLAMRYRTATGTKGNRDAALRWFRSAAEEGYPPSQFELGMLLIERKATAEEGRTWLEAAARAGHLPALAALVRSRRPPGPAHADPLPRWLDREVEEGMGAKLAEYRSWLRLEAEVSDDVGRRYPQARFSIDAAGDLAWYRERLEELGVR